MLHPVFTQALLHLTTSGSDAEVRGIAFYRLSQLEAYIMHIQSTITQPGEAKPYTGVVECKSASGILKTKEKIKSENVSGGATALKFTLQQVIACKRTLSV